MNIGTLAPLLERFDYDRANLLDQEIHDALVELAAWRDLEDYMGCDTPQEIHDALVELAEWRDLADYMGCDTPQEIHDALVELAAWRDLADDMGCDTPQEMEDHIDNLQDHQCKNHEDYGDLKEFFDDCVSSLNAHWPAAEVYDQNLRAVIMNAIKRGDTDDES